MISLLILVVGRYHNSLVCGYIGGSVFSSYDATDTINTAV